MKRLIVIFCFVLLFPTFAFGQTTTPTAAPTDTPTITPTPTNTPTSTPTNTPTIPATPINANRTHNMSGPDASYASIDGLNLGYDAGTTDAYVATFPGVTVAHGTVLTLFVNTANTGACTLNAVPIKTSGGDDPADNYMEADSFCQVIYNSQKGWYQLLSPDANP